MIQKKPSDLKTIRSDPIVTDTNYSRSQNKFITSKMQSPSEKNKIGLDRMKSSDGKHSQQKRLE